ncbi:hypothetical protein JKP88DRAFT_347868 [Tribonema minus]|uniref:Plastid lipid-associated protein/fibrillin conserved domain-containing protein n=1 Tax=Tribonema minus TaxID=303371 RepID=A0A835ZGL9_9STRA|nr:hypothetical protein JKP88DRAFT_347868 [Tribonema minus]
MARPCRWTLWAALLSVPGSAFFGSVAVHNTHRGRGCIRLGSSDNSDYLSNLDGESKSGAPAADYLSKLPRSDAEKKTSNANESDDYLTKLDQGAPSTPTSYLDNLQGDAATATGTVGTTDAPESTEPAAPVADNEGLQGLKDQLLKMALGTNRGFSSRMEERRDIADIVAELEIYQNIGPDGTEAQGSVADSVRLNLAFQSSAFTPLTFLGRKVDDVLRPLKFNFPSKLRNVGWLEHSFVDKDIRIARAFGSMFVLLRC